MLPHFLGLLANLLWYAGTLYISTCIICSVCILEDLPLKEGTKMLQYWVSYINCGN